MVEELCFKMRQNGVRDKHDELVDGLLARVLYSSYFGLDGF
jgi:hypothetical protein